MEALSLDKYSTLIFDCDGVVLDSNKLKSEAFYEAVLPYGPEIARRFVDYHKQNGGISRQRKFAYFLKNIRPKGTKGPDLETLLDSYAIIVRRGLLECQIADGLSELKEKTNSTKWLVASGGAQVELREVFSSRKITSLFDGGIFGNPDSKDDILSREIENGNIQFPAVMFGDSQYDHIAASGYGIDFVFVSDWTEFSDWKQYCATNQLPFIHKISDLNFRPHL